ncbi:hypothetical protein V498_07786 [Pseudogymnoascus sp. VKM F-4517 (FW-2822)]|nr:hypothetical protein V498_07786 [Pseudogymnoascus sp. VKM F-4517 (FW-2822)]
MDPYDAVPSSSDGRDEDQNKTPTDAIAAVSLDGRALVEAWLFSCTCKAEDNSWGRFIKCQPKRGVTGAGGPVFELRGASMKLPQGSKDLRILHAGPWRHPGAIRGHELWDPRVGYWLHVPYSSPAIDNVRTSYMAQRTEPYRTEAEKAKP